MAAAVNVNFDWIHVRTGEELLKIIEHADCLFPRACFAKQGTAIFFG
jgi:hypothetical protein